VLTPEEELKARQVLAERAHQQALKNAEVEAKAQLGNMGRDSKAKTPPPPAEQKPVETTAKGAEGTGPDGPAALPITAAKKQRLTALLDAYMKDQITPSQYHLERAKILAEP